MAPREPSWLLDKMLVRVDVCVEFFMLLSGFMTHYVYHSKDIESSFGSMMAFFARRAFRCLLAPALLKNQLFIFFMSAQTQSSSLM
ncbi:unnamed protein product [Symbiodinium natans]|uniref:Uncharacterized protein n=1 Tax=Symbiodinium natans TaxID=878477 RepID=A0A812NDP9_9DINO|nr:unnamed protein product [Symbiodinium natans]